EGVAEALPDFLARGGNVDMPVGGLEYAGGNAGGVVVAGLLRDLAFHQPACGLEIQHEDLRLQQGGVDLLTFMGLLPLQEGDEDAHGAEQPGCKVGDRDADPDRPLPGLAGDRHQAAHALGDLIEAGTLRIGTILAKAGDAGVDEARIDLAQYLVIDAEPRLHVGAEVLYDHVGFSDHLLECRDALGGLEVERHAPLVAVQIHEIGAVAWAAQRLAALQVSRGFDLDDVGSPVGKLAHTG